ncbi:hypothetical protein D3C81_2166000 [compost metagenome]
MRAAYESAFNLEEAQNWLNRHLKRFEEYGFGLWAVVLKETNEAPWVFGEITRLYEHDADVLIYRGSSVTRI